MIKSTNDSLGNAPVEFWLAVDVVKVEIYAVRVRSRILIDAIFEFQWAIIFYCIFGDTLVDYLFG